ncbi:hypothetical protein [Streptomyces sp. MH60]|uniref:hypothetical protein n=1 Tax=Streptomyces sp. MH60 TaxID=1940758 RepID=UPI0010575D4C|nr:hypothetical protein [Streptomyces sp. MH60]
MSRDKVFLIVEGRDYDRAHYSRICESSKKIKDAGYQVWLVEQIRDEVTGKSAGGKPAVLSFFDHCKRGRSLQLSSPLGDRLLFFCLDRDNEQISGGGRRNPHILYTQNSDVEADIFAHGISEEVMMSSLSLDRWTARKALGYLGDWRLELAVLWREWVELCCLAKALDARCDVGFGRESSINPDKYGIVDPALAAAARARVRRRSKLPPSETSKVEAKVAVKISSAYATGDARRTLKGKWIPNFLAWKLKCHFGENPVAMQGFEVSIGRLVMHSIDYSGKWVAFYHKRIEAML